MYQLTDFLWKKLMRARKRKKKPAQTLSDRQTDDTQHKTEIKINYSI